MASTLGSSVMEIVAVDVDVAVGVMVFVGVFVDAGEMGCVAASGSEYVFFGEYACAVLGIDVIVEGIQDEIKHKSKTAKSVFCLLIPETPYSIEYFRREYLRELEWLSNYIKKSEPSDSRH
jgi:hypothetical protein